jgi:UDP:flavonoid glycosyltransferase YjiC (YdhE family)
VMPVNGADGEKLVDVAEFDMKVKRVLNEPSYRQSAKRVAESIRHFGGAGTAAERIEEGVFAQGLKRR